MANLLRRCHECGQPIGKKEVFCPRCGAKQPRDPKRRSITATGHERTSRTTSKHARIALAD